MWLKEIERYMGSDSAYKLLLVGNKADQAASRAVEKNEAEVWTQFFFPSFCSYLLQEMAKELGCHFLETSAKDNSNVEQIFETLCRDLKDS